MRVGNKVRITWVMVLALLATMVLTGYYAGRVVAATSACGQIARAFQAHGQTIYDPETETITVISYESERNYDRSHVTFGTAFALKDCAANANVVAHIKSLQVDNQRYEAQLCAQLRRVLANQEPVPVKNGQAMNLEAAKNYVATKCAAVAPPATGN